jgi:type II secretory pathway predicted ATPase ExeA
VLVGEAGTGKTTLLRAALESDRCRGTKCIHLSNPTLTRDEFIEVLADQFGLGAEAAGSKTRLLSSLEAMLRAARDRGETMALVVDEAQSLSASCSRRSVCSPTSRRRPKSCCRWCLPVSRLWPRG